MYYPNAFTMTTDAWLLAAIIGVFILGIVAQAMVSRRFSQNAKIRATINLPAHEVASQLLQQGGSSVRIEKVHGNLTDHYNPKTHTVGLSETVYGQSSVAAVAVAAHEIGHVMQYQAGYTPIRIRNAILPVANIGSQAAPLLVILGLVLGYSGLAYFGVILFSAVLLFQLATLPVEFNASRRAIAMLQDGNYLTPDEIPRAKSVLRAAAFTYVVAALSSLISLLRLFLIARSSKDRD
ncbi:MAG: zinc metallopeptidase [Christensenellaceae bacterium]|jgi:Zn-dependent membrane protease YugP